MPSVDSADLLKQQQLKRRPRRVDFYERKDDHECALLAAMGMSTSYIMAKTGLSACQVTYRIGLAGFTTANGCSRMDYRNGKSPFASYVLSVARTSADNRLLAHLRQHVE